MRERIYRTETLILRRTNLGEADRLLLVATPAGKRRIVAKGVRKTSSRIAGHIELFTHTRMLLAIGRNLDIITQSEVVNAFPTLRNDLDRLGCAYYVAELYDRFTQEEEENQALFRLLIATCAALDTSPHIDLVLRFYELHLLSNSGYRPQLHRCAVSHEPLTPEANRFSPTLGGAISPAYAHQDHDALLMHLPTFKLLRYLQTEPLEAIERLNLSAAVRQEAATLLQAYIQRILERKLKSEVFLESLRHTSNLQARTNHDVST